MKYVSTRGSAAPRQFSELLTRGTAEDGGLYVPQSWPELSADELSQMSELPYAQLAAKVIALFGGDGVDPAMVSAATEAAFSTFSAPEGPPIEKIDNDLWSLQLFHGPTFAFKDYALVPLAELIDRTLIADNRQATVLCATSGDTGAAAAAAFANRERLKAVVLFPTGRVSPVQQRQITTLGADNVLPISVDGDFDDCQRIIKSLYLTPEAGEYGYTAVNSINIARILLQTAYYIHTSAVISKDSGGSVNFVVPTGNFGNIFAGYIAKRMGSPINELVISSNDNDVLPRLFETGAMSKSTTHKTISPSMDIQVSSNFERLLWLIKQGDGASVTQAQNALDKDGGYSLTEEEMARLTSDFAAVRCDESCAIDAMRWMQSEYETVVCPHSATGFYAAKQLVEAGNLKGNTVVVETAHPAKFPDAVEQALNATPERPERLEAIMTKPEHYVHATASVEAIQSEIKKAFG